MTNENWNLSTDVMIRSGFGSGRAISLVGSLACGMLWGWTAGLLFSAKDNKLHQAPCLFPFGSDKEYIFEWKKLAETCAYSSKLDTSKAPT